MNKRVICEALICGEWYRISVEDLYPHKLIKRKCPVCNSEIKLMKKGHNGQKAHFEHQKKNPNCSESIAYKGDASFDPNHVQPIVKETKKDIEESFNYGFLLEFIINGDSLEPILCEDSFSALSQSEELIVSLKEKPKGQLVPKKIEGKVEQYYRDARVVAYSLTLANGSCQLCEKPAPFKTKKGRPYLEVHHVYKLSDGGADTIENVVALCPNCHRKAHFSDESDLIIDHLLARNKHITKPSTRCL